MADFDPVEIDTGIKFYLICLSVLAPALTLHC